MSLRLKLFIPLLAFSLLLVLYLITAWLPRNNTHLIEVYETTFSRHLDSVTEGLVPLLMANELAEVHGILYSLLDKNPRWKAITLDDAQGNRLFPHPLHAGMLHAGHPPPAAPELRHLERQIFYADQLLGNLSLDVDLSEDLAAIRRQGQTLVIALLVVLALFVVLTGITIDTLVRRPLKLLARAADRLGKGDFDAPLPQPRADEIGRLSSRFALMRTAVQDSQAEVAREMGERKQAEKNLALSDTVFESSIEGIIITDAESKILRINKAFTTITGFSEAESLGRTPAMLSSGRHKSEFYRVLWEAVITKGRWQGEVWNRRKAGELYPEWLSISVAHNDKGEISHYIGMFTDITEKKLAEERIHHLVHHDPLTGLANRLLFNDRLTQALLHAQRADELVAVLFLDLDRFKTINDTLGHPFGDRLLQAVSERLSICARQGDTVARLGGDEFVIILPDLSNEQAAGTVAQKILTMLSNAYVLDDSEVFVTTSIGVALFPHDATDRETLIKNADTAMYHAKQLGRNNYQFYSQDMSVMAVERLGMENKLRRALEREEFLLYYQPQIDLGSGRIIGAEALIRWQHPELGLVSPAEFIPLLEETGLIVAVGEWVLHRACTQTKGFHAAAGKKFRVAVNLSPLQFQQSNLVLSVQQALDETGLAAEWLELEITEGSIMTDAEGSAATLRELSAMGIRLAIDDFGTGYSSLSYLKRFPIDMLKIDQSFVRDVITDQEDAAIVRTIVNLSHSLHLQVIAEGVETPEQREFLLGCLCDHIQGYHISRPLPAAEFLKFLSDHREQEQTMLSLNRSEY